MIQIKCNVCDKSPVHILPKPDSVTENDTYYDEDKNIWYKNYPVEYMI